MLGLDNLGGAYKTQVYDTIDKNAINLFVNNILSDMESILNSRQLTSLHEALQETILDYSISLTEEVLYIDKTPEELNNELLKQFLDDKRLAGLTERTLEAYEQSLNYIFEWVDKGVDTITSEDIKDFFNYKIEHDHTSLTTLDNYRRFLNSFYVHCVNNGLLFKNPILKIPSMKRPRKIKEAFSDTEVIYLRENITTLRDKAIFELLLSSGMRVGELVKLDINDLHLRDCSVIVHGKGNKERECFFNTLASVSIERYLASRTDNNPALFVSLHSPYNRLGISGVETMIRGIGERAGVVNVHPHRFRRHFATTLLNKGVQIEQIQQLLGHAEIDTTMMYIDMNDDEVAYNHRRYVN